MIKFTLFSYDETRSFKLYGNSIVVTDISGLGTNLDLTKSDGADRYYISDVSADFEDIKMKMYFGVKGNAYYAYQELMQFFAQNGKHKFILEYQVNNEIKYCDVWLKKAPKGQKDGTGTLNEEFVFSRLSHWYTKISVSFSMQTEHREVDFPLEIPIPFVGDIHISDVELINDFFEDFFLDITIVGPLDHDLEIYLKNSYGHKIHQVVVQQRLKETDIFYIDSETKKVTYYDGYSVILENAYNNLDHNYDSFITVPNGKHSIGVAMLSGDQCVVTVSYRKLVLD